MHRFLSQIERILQVNRLNGRNRVALFPEDVGSGKCRAVDA
jgi:hypothetical protein